MAGIICSQGGVVSYLLRPITIGVRQMRNRIVLPPMVREHGDAFGCVTESALDYYRRRAAAGVGLIIVEATAVEPAGRAWPGGLCAYSPAHLPGLTDLAACIHDEGAATVLQLVHGGPKAATRLSGCESVAPSAVQPSGSRPIPQALTVERIHVIEEQFAAAAALALQAGFDGVEVHGAHGYLLDAFLSRKQNTRSDEYGGAMPNRIRMLTETCRLVRERVGDGPLVGCRISLFNKLHEGFSHTDLSILVHGLEASGIDLLHVSTQSVFREYFGTQKTLGQYVKELTDRPVIVAGRLREPAQAERAISEGHGDLAAVGTAMMNNADWARRAAHTLASG
jgi:NADPH2 dehydrogenase